MAKDFNYTTSDEQITHLRGKGLIFDNETNAKRNLERYGYYNIINSYRGPYQTIVNGKKEYLSGTTFEQIFSMFTLDHNLRNSIMASMLDLEECLRAATAEVIAKNFGLDHHSYLDFKNFRDRPSTNPKFSLRNILGTLHTNVHSGKNPIKYYRETYDIVPPWILLKGTYFSTLVNLIKCLKHSQKQQLLHILVTNLDREIDAEIISLFQTVLFICLDYRNAAAHGGRIYNFQSSHADKLKITDNVITHFPHLQNADSQTGIYQFINLLSIFNNRQSIRIITATLNQQIDRHLKIYPRDITLLSENYGIQIDQKTYVFINEKTKLYHYNPNCSGISNAHRIPLSAQIETDYIPCKRCVTPDKANKQ